MASKSAKVGRPRTTWADVVVPIVFDRWEIATEGTASAMRNAKSKIHKGEYGEDLEAMVAYDRRAGKHVLLVRKQRHPSAIPEWGLHWDDAPDLLHSVE